MTKINIEGVWRFLSTKTFTVAHSRNSPTNGSHLAQPDQNHLTRLKQVCKNILRMKSTHFDKRVTKPGMKH